MGSRLAAYVVAGLLTLGVTAGSLVFFERAVVRVSVQPKQVQVTNVAMPAATMRLDATASESLTVTSNSTRQLPATFATGYVTFWCTPMTSCPNGYTVPAGTLLGSVSGAKYVTDTGATFPSCSPSSEIRVTALTPGAGGNAGAGALLYAAVPSYIHVTNHGGIAGGVNARTIPIVSQSDIDAATTQLTAKLEPELSSQLRAQAGLLSVVPTGSPTFKTVTSAHAGDTAASVTVTVSGTLSGVAFSSAGAQTWLRGLLAQRAAAGYALTNQPLVATYAVDTNSGVVTASATGYAAPSINSAAVAALVRGQTISAAGERLQQAVHGSSVRISTEPLTVPWLPVLADHISVVVIAN